MNKARTIAGIGVGSGKKESFYFCAFQNFENEDRWFLRNCQQLKDVKYPDTEDNLLSWIRDYKLETLMVDFPLTSSVCNTCSLPCPGSIDCQQEEVLSARKKINGILDLDKQLQFEDPKKYEQLRRESDYEKIISKSLKRKLNKGFIPYWHRSSDLDVWLNYHDRLLKYFKVSYDSFGNENTTQMMRFQYLDRHFPKDLFLAETNYHIILLELLEKGIIKGKSLRELSSLESSAIARLDIMNALEKKFDLFIYDKDKEVLAKKLRAFKSFIIGFSGIYLEMKKVDKRGFFIPRF